MLLPHGFAIEILHLLCMNLSKLRGTGSMSVLIGCSLEPSNFQLHSNGDQDLEIQY